jgi:hypothetical protein
VHLSTLPSFTLGPLMLQFAAAFEVVRTLVSSTLLVRAQLAETIGIKVLGSVKCFLHAGVK